MKKFVVAVMALAVMAGCGEDRLKVIHNNDRVTELERRANLNDQLNVLQNQRLDALEAALAAETAAREEGDLQLSADLQAEMDARVAADDNLRDLLAAEEAARVAGDGQLRADLQIEIANRVAGDAANSAALAASVFAQSLVNMAVQIQLSQVNSKITDIYGKIANLTNRVNNLEEDLRDLEDEVGRVRADMETVRLDLQGQIDTLSAKQAATQAQLDQEGVKLFKCNAPTSTERIMKINGKFYAVMNRVKTEQISVFAESTPVTFSNPKLCLKGNKAKLPGGGGNCPSGWTTVGGNEVTVPTYSSSPKTVVKEVRIALDILTDGNYQTTDGGAPCSFSISGGGTTQTGLIAVQ